MDKDTRQAPAQQGWILVSDRLAGSVDTDSVETPKFAVVCENRSQMLHRIHDGNPGQVLLIVPPEDVEFLESSLEKSSSDNVQLAFVVLDREGRGNIRYTSSVVAVRNSEITAAELDFLASRVFEKSWNTTQGRMTGLLDAHRDLEELIEIGKSLSLEKDFDRLLRNILFLSKKITGADAGSIFLAEESEAGDKLLRFKYSHTFSKDLSYEEFTMTCDTSSIAGYVAVTGEILNLPDAYDIPAETPYSFNQSFDRKHGYRCKSMLVVPMRNHLDEIIGVIQLINSKETEEAAGANTAFEVRLNSEEDFRTKVVSFANRYEGLLEAVAGQAAIAIENNRMILQIEQQFDEFVKASVYAIESRDPATSGHSSRVAQICVAMANAVTASLDGAFKDISFSANDLKELELAGLLHDFGKVYIDPAVFLKAKKLVPKDKDYLQMRLAFLHRSIELRYVEHERDVLNRSESTHADDVQKLRDKRDQELKRLHTIVSLVNDLNEPRLQRDDPDQIIGKIQELGKDLVYQDLKDQDVPLLSDDELINLSTRMGSLNPEERKIIESHVVHTYNFVSKIPWPPEFKNIPSIVAGHHEKLDGSGYPEGIVDIPLQGRMMSIADIFDALTAGDRPYKKPVPLDRVLGILREEADDGKLDADLVELFIGQKLFELALSE